MNRLDEIETKVAACQLAVFGVVHDDLPKGVGTLLLLGPKEPGFWDTVTATAEFTDGAPDPLDRWSTRVISGLAENLNATAYFPFGGQPYQPFIQWAQASGRAHVSPVGLMVHDVAGLMLSYRGALGFAEVIAAPAPPPGPCLTCQEKPCLAACPVDALSVDAYDVPACKADLERAGNDCVGRGWRVRRTCPVSQAHGRQEAQSAFHMRAFR